MPAPTGNKYAQGCENSGRPAKYTYEIKEKEFEELLNWSTKSDSHNLLEFTFDKDYTLSMLGDWARENEEFARAYKKAKERLGHNIRKQLHSKKNPYEKSAFHREIGNYDTELHGFEREGKIFEAELKRKTENVFSEEDQKNIKNFLSDIKKRNNIIREDGLP